MVPEDEVGVGAGDMSEGGVNTGDGGKDDAGRS